MSSLVVLGFSQFVSGPKHQAGHTLDLIFGAGLVVDLVIANAVPLCLEDPAEHSKPTLFRQ